MAMAKGATVAESQLHRIIRDLHEAVTELAKEYRETGEPITDDSTNLHKFSYKLEYLLQFDQKEKSTFLGTKKDYWDYFSDCLAKIKGANDGVRFVKSITELKTSLGKGRAFIRYSLVHQRLADTLQQCLMNQRVTSDWYYARSPFVKSHLSADIINHLYELNEVQFDVASRGHDLDASWPTFARRTLANSPGHMWKPPSRSSSINSLVSTYSQQAHEFPSSPDYGHNLLTDLNESLPVCPEDMSTVDDLRLELDQSELKQQQLLDNVQQLGEEAAELRGIVVELQKQLDVSLAAQEEQQVLQVEVRGLQEREQSLSKEVERLNTKEKAMEDEQRLLKQSLAAADTKNVELLAKLDGVLNEKGQQAASYFNSAQKIHELLDKLKEAERGKMEAVAEAESKKRLGERLETELKLKEAAAREGETKLGALVTSTSEEKMKLMAKVEEQSSALDKLQGSLTQREKEANNLQKQLRDLQKSLEEAEKEVEMVKRMAQEDKERMHMNVNDLKKMLEAEVSSFKEEVEKKEEELTSTFETLQQLRTQNQSLNTEREKLTNTQAELEANVKELTTRMEECKTQCTNLTDLNEKLLTTVRKNEELKEEMDENRGALEAEVSALRASEKQLRGQLDDTKLTVDEKEKLLREENCKLDESLQRATMAASTAESTSKRLQQENKSLKEEQDSVKTALGKMQADLKSVHGQIAELEKNLGASRKNEGDLQEQLKTKEDLLVNKEVQLKTLQSKVKALIAKEKELEIARADAEATLAKQAELIQRVTCEKQAMEMSQLERSAVQEKENQEIIGKLAVVESQLELSMKDVSRLQAETLDLRVKGQRSEEEKLTFQAQLEVTEAQRDELRILTEQLKSQTEALNQKHIEELMECQKKEEKLMEKHNREMASHAESALSAAAVQDELSSLKALYNKLVLENTEIREGLHRANTEMAELGMTICKLSAEKEEATQLWTSDTARIAELEKEVERGEECVTELRQENYQIRQELIKKESLLENIVELQEQLEKSKDLVQNVKESNKEEMEAIKFQMSSENMNHQNQMKSVTEQLNKVKTQLQEELKRVNNLQTEVSELKVENEQFLLLVGEKDAHITKAEATIRESESEIQQLREAVNRVEEAHTSAQMGCEELEQKLNKANTELQSQSLKLTAEIDDLNRTKTNLEERLIELIRDKDALWQKTDALEFEQKLRAEERWWLMDKEATHCLDCQGQFTWFLRRHHCRLCGRIFCYYCSNNFVMTKQSGKKERCCKECYTQHTAVVERFTEAELSPADTQPPPDGAGPQPPPEPAPYTPTPRVTVSESGIRSDDGAFDIITEEEVNGVYDSDTNSQTTGGSLDGEQDRPPPGALNIGLGDNAEDHSEITLLKSGEVTMVVPLSIDGISQFGDGSRELFIKSSCYSVLTVDMRDCGQTISWMFSSEPKSISFSVVYQESADTPVEQTKVLIPLTRCNSHEETVQGQLKVRHPGHYILIFDNSFSRFISKKVFYHLTMEKPVIYDGSDCS